MWRVAFDIGGVLSKYPDFFRAVIESFTESGIECHVITDMHIRLDTLNMLKENGIDIPDERVHNSDYEQYGEACKAMVMKEYKIDVLFDDFMGYLIWPFEEKAPIRFLTMPDATRPYWHEKWKAEGNFGRRTFKKGNYYEKNKEHEFL